MVIAAGAYYRVQTVHTNTSGAVRSTYCVDYAHPLSKSIGVTATKILNHLHASGRQSAKEIASATGKHRSTITRQLAKLIDQELVIKNGDTYHAVRLDTVEEMQYLRQSGAYSEQIKLRERHDLDRALFALNPILAHLFKKNEKKQEAQ